MLTSLEAGKNTVATKEENSLVNRPVGHRRVSRRNCWATQLLSQNIKVGQKLFFFETGSRGSFFNTQPGHETKDFAQNSFKVQGMLRWEILLLEFYETTTLIFRDRATITWNISFLASKTHISQLFLWVSL